MYFGLLYAEIPLSIKWKNKIFPLVVPPLSAEKTQVQLAKWNC